MKKCKVCEEKTKIIFNINLKAVSICDKCARSICRQEIDDMFNRLTSSQSN